MIDEIQEVSSVPQEVCHMIQVKKIVKRKISMASLKPNAATLKQVQGSLKKFITILKAASQKDINESDTCNIINDILGDVLGYDKFFDVTTEYKIKGQYADYGIRINNKVIAFIEVKAINIALNQNHLFQVASYAVHEGVDWAILTNGNVWQLYRIEDTKPVKLTQVISIDLFDDSLRFPIKSQIFSAFHKRSFVSKYAEMLWREKSCVNAEVAKKILLSKVGISFLQKQLKRQSGYRVDEEKVKSLLCSILDIK
jgi:hypothetical protein